MIFSKTLCRISMDNMIKKKILLLLHRLLDIEKKIFNKKKYFQKDFFLYKEYNNLLKIKNYFNLWKKYTKDLKFAKSLLQDKELSILAKEEIKKVHYSRKITCIKLEKLIKNIYKDKHDTFNVYLEIYAGTGGKEAALFVCDLSKMYIKYSEKKKWKVKVINVNTNDHGGFKEIILKISGKNVYKKLKFESGGHRVQRVPLTENQGRIHTSTCIVAVMPDIPVKQLPQINNEDIRIDTFKSSGAGGQHVNTTDSAIRITHIPTGIVVECQQERSQFRNKIKALSILKSRIYSLRESQKKKKESFLRKNLLGTGLRSDRNRTYNFPQNRVTDHRINLTIYSLNNILSGDLDLLIKPIIIFNNNNYENN